MGAPSRAMGSRTTRVADRAGEPEALTPPVLGTSLPFIHGLALRILPGRLAERAIRAIEERLGVLIVAHPVAEPGDGRRALLQVAAARPEPHQGTDADGRALVDHVE